MHFKESVKSGINRNRNPYSVILRTGTDYFVFIKTKLEPESKKS